MGLGATTPTTGVVPDEREAADSNVSTAACALVGVPDLLPWATFSLDTSTLASRRVPNER